MGASATHFCVHAYLLQFVCQGYSVVRAKKSHDIYVPEKKDKKQLVSKRDGAQSKNPVLQCLDFGCTHGLRKPSKLPLQMAKKKAASNLAFQAFEVFIGT